MFTQEFSLAVWLHMQSPEPKKFGQCRYLGYFGPTKKRFALVRLLVYPRTLNPKELKWIWKTTKFSCQWLKKRINPLLECFQLHQMVHTHHLPYVQFDFAKNPHRCSENANRRRALGRFSKIPKGFQFFLTCRLFLNLPFQCLFVRNKW